MGIASSIRGDVVFQDNVRFGGTVDIPAGTVTDADVAASAGIAASKVVHRFPVTYKQATGSAVAAQTSGIHIAGAAGIIASIALSVDVAAVGNAAVTVDLKRSTAGGAYASVLTGVINVTSALAVRTLSEGTLDGAKDDYIADDILQIVVTADAGTGTLPQGLTVTVWLQEQPA